MIGKLEMSSFQNSLDELLGLPYMVGKLEMSSFQNNLNLNKLPPLASGMF
jgi:hypothetical protein